MTGRGPSAWIEPALGFLLALLACVFIAAMFVGVILGVLYLQRWWAGLP